MPALEFKGKPSLCRTRLPWPASGFATEAAVADAPKKASTGAAGGGMPGDMGYRDF